MSSADLFVKIESLPSELRKEVEAFIDGLLRQKQKGQSQRKAIPFGKFKGKLRIAADFDAPFDDFKEYR